MKTLISFLTQPVMVDDKLRVFFNYALIGLLINNGINDQWVTDSNPDGLVGFWGYALMLGSLAISTTWTVLELNSIDRQRARISG